MSALRQFGVVTAAGGTDQVQIALPASRGSGDLLIACNTQYGGTGYQAVVNVQQGPTISGPWTPVPTPQPPTIDVPPGVGTQTAVSLVRVQWSMPFMQLDISPPGQGAVQAVLITPGGNTLR